MAVGLKGLIIKCVDRHVDNIFVKFLNYWKLIKINSIFSSRLQLQLQRTGIPKRNGDGQRR